MSRSNGQYAPMVDEPTTAMAVQWDRRRPTRVTFRKPDQPRAPVKGRTLSARDQKTFKKSLKMSFANPDVGYYGPCADLTPRPSSRDFQGQPLDWSSEKSVSGQFEVWGPAVPGDNRTIPEPRDVLFAGERGFLVVRITNRSSAPVVVLGGAVQSGRAGAAKGRSQAKLAVPPQETLVYTVPIAIAETADAAFTPVSLRISCSIAGKRVALSHRTHLTIGRMRRFDQEQVRSKKAGESTFALSLTAEMPGGVVETVATSVKVSTRVDRRGTVRIDLLPLSYDASVVVSQAFAATAMLPNDLYFSVASMSTVREIARGVFQVATAAIMGALATAGVWLTKILIAAAAQALGPAVGVPVTLVLYSPPLEAWFAKAAVAVLGVTGAVLNGELFDSIFPPTPAPGPAPA